MSHIISLRMGRLKKSLSHVRSAPGRHEGRYFPPAVTHLGFVRWREGAPLMSLLAHQSIRVWADGKVGQACHWQLFLALILSPWWKKNLLWPLLELILKSDLLKSSMDSPSQDSYTFPFGFPFCLLPARAPLFLVPLGNLVFLLGALVTFSLRGYLTSLSEKSE